MIRSQPRGEPVVPRAAHVAAHVERPRRAIPPEIYRPLAVTALVCHDDESKFESARNYVARVYRRAIIGRFSASDERSVCRSTRFCSLSRPPRVHYRACLHHRSRPADLPGRSFFKPHSLSDFTGRIRSSGNTRVTPANGLVRNTCKKSDKITLFARGYLRKLRPQRETFFRRRERREDR